MANPAYMTDRRYIDAANAYANQLRSQLAQQEKAMNDQLATSKAGVGAQYDSSAAQNYINYMRQQNALPEELQAQGISGGASESATARMMNNYALNQANNSASRNAALGQLQNSFDTNLAEMRHQLDQTIADNAYQAQQQQMQFNYNLQQKALEQFQATIERFTSVNSVNKAINALNPNDPNYTAMKQLLELRRAQLGTSSGGGGGGGGGRSYRGYGGGYGGGGSSTASSSTVNKIAETVRRNTNKAGKATAKATSRRSGKAYRGSRRSYTSRRNISRGGIW